MSNYPTPEGGETMGSLLYTIGAILVVLWVLGFLLAHVGGDLIHLLLAVAVIVFLVQFFSGRRSI